MKRNLAGTWHNQHGSELDLEISPEARISGKFRSATGLARGAGGCEVTGYVAGDLLVFCANFGQFDSLTAWAGHVTVEGGEARLHMQWQLSVALPPRGSAEQLWKGVWAGSDLFRRGPATIEKAPSQMPSHPIPDWP
jgi:hypothetical protein